MTGATPRLAWLPALLVLRLAAWPSLASAATADEAEVLLTLRNSVDDGSVGNWETGTSSAMCQASPGADWVAGTEPCGSNTAAAWFGVSCNAQGAVVKVSLSNCWLQGTLPPELAKLQQLQVLDLSRNTMVGGIPKEWTATGAFPSLETLNLAFNALSGALSDFNMDAGGFIASKSFNVSANSFNQGPIPGVWYSKTLAALDFSFNGLSGRLPLMWGEPVDGMKSHFPSLNLLALQGNNLSGPGDPWPAGSAALFGPNFMCIWEPGNPNLEVDPMMVSPTPTSSSDTEVLLSLKGSVINWDAALASPGCQAAEGADWLAGMPPCGNSMTPGWRGVSCNSRGAVTGVRLPSCGLQGMLPSALADLRYLEELDLSHNKFSGKVPMRWRMAGSFASLRTLNLAHNELSGGLDDFNMDASGFMAGGSFNISKNSFNQTAIPGGWYSRSLEQMDLSYNGISGLLPVEWAAPKAGHEANYPSAFPSLQLLAVQGNNLSGPADPWPKDGANTFGSDFTVVSSPGNPYLAIDPDSVDGAGMEDSSGSGSGLSSGAIAGIAVGAAAGIVIVALLAAFVVKRRRRTAAPEPSPEWLATKVSGGSDSVGVGDVEDGQGNKEGSSFKGGARPGGDFGTANGGVPMGSAFEGKRVSATPTAAVVAGGPSGRSSGDLMGDGSSRNLRRGDSGRTFGTMLVDTDAKRLPAMWNTVLFSELELESNIGAGSFGAVWRAKYCQTSVAVKLLGGDKTPGASDTTHQRKITRQLEKEAGIMSKLRHTNICLYMGACLEPPCLLMEYCARKSVDSLLAQGLKDQKAAKQLSWPRLLSMASDAAKGMVYLHSRQPAVYHRDLKSANLLVTSQWQVKVADFNLSRALEPTDFMSSLCIQNPRWLAPEVLAGEDGGLPADVWAFGTVLWELMTWRAPFEGCNPYQIINTVQATQHGSGLTIPGPAELPAGPLGEYQAYVELVEACWQRDPRRRPTFEEVVDRLRTILQTEMRRNQGPGVPSLNSNASIHTAATSVQEISPRSTVPSVTASSQPSAAGANLQATLASQAGSHDSFEAATQATSMAFVEALRASFAAASSQGMGDGSSSRGLPSPVDAVPTAKPSGGGGSLAAAESMQPPRPTS